MRRPPQSPTMKEPDSTKVTLRLPADLVKQGKHLAVDTRQSFQDVVALS